MLIVALLCSALPGAASGAFHAPDAAPLADQGAPADPAPLTAAPLADQHLPSLTLHLAVAPDTLAVGDTATFTLTVDNQADDPAEDLLVTLPMPDGAQALPDPRGVSAASAGWRWDLGHLNAHDRTTLTGAMRLERMPRGQALVAHAQATARGLDLPIHEYGGALVAEGAPSAATARFVPGAAARLRSADGRVQVDLPARAAARALTLRHEDVSRTRGASLPRIALAGRGFGAFSLDATDDSGMALHQFSAPLTVAVSYTPEQLQALGIAEADLTLFWHNEDTNAWEAIPTSVDPLAQTASATVDHFSDFQLGDGSSPSAAFLPSLQGFQVSSFTGSASYSYPIDVPAGPGGLKPSVELSYSSGATDGDGGKRLKQQAGWVGQGWSLDTGSVAGSKMRNGETYYTVVFNGQSYDLLRGAALSGIINPDPNDPSDWDWRPTRASFACARSPTAARPPA